MRQGGSKIKKVKKTIERKEEKRKEDLKLGEIRKKSEKRNKKKATALIIRR